MIHSTKNIVNIKGLAIVKPEIIVEPQEAMKPKTKRTKKLLTTDNVSFVKTNTPKNLTGKRNGQSSSKKNS